MIDLKRNSKKELVPATGKRVRASSIYKPRQTQDFKISRGKFSDFLTCPRCFYMERVMAIKFLLVTSGQQFNMVSSWEDELYCSILKDGSISLRPSKDGEDEYGGRWWFPSRRGIKTPKQFFDAIYAIDEIEAGNWSIQDDMLPVLFEHAPLFASLTNLYIEIEDNQEEEDLDFFLFCQKVILSSEIDLPDDFKSAVKLVEIIFNFVKQERSKTNEFPQGLRLLKELLGRCHLRNPLFNLCPPECIRLKANPFLV